MVVADKTIFKIHPEKRIIRFTQKGEITSRKKDIYPDFRDSLYEKIIQVLKVV